MGRYGVDYSQVAKAAIALMEADEPVTVDNVRIRLGGTGSKSTIAPLLKRWKAENADSVERAQLGLPPDLLQSVQRLYSTLQQRFEEDLEAARAEAMSRVDELSAENLQLTQQLTDHERRCQKLDNELSDTQSQLAALKEQLDAERTSRRERDFAYASLEQRWNERASEISHLREQIAQAHQQFSHFEAAAQARWEKERDSNESKLAAAMQSEALLRAQLQNAQKEGIVSKTKLDQVSHAHRKLLEDRATLTTDLDELRQTCATKEQTLHQAEFELHLCRDSNHQLQVAHDAISASAQQLETELAISRSQLDLLQKALDNAEARTDVINQEQLRGLQKCAEYEAELRLCRRALQSKT